MRLVIAKWVDAVATAHWTDDPVEPTVNTSVGFVVYETEDYIQLAGTIDSLSSLYNNSMTIPTGMIIDTKELPYENEFDESERAEAPAVDSREDRSEEHTSELQSH